MTTYKPNPEFIKKTPAERRKAWADALRSGEYQQCVYTLFDGEGYCCLGVKAKIEGHSDCDLRDGLDLDGYDPFIAIVDGEKRHASSLNDGHGFTFPQIADLIEGKEVTV